MPALQLLLDSVQRPLTDLIPSGDTVTMLFSQTFALLCCLSWAIGLPSGSELPRRQSPSSGSGSQNVVTYDKSSVFINGKRILLYSAEFHAFRLPVAGLWLDIFQKLKAAGFSGVSFYTDWALLEGNPGNFTAEGLFALEPFFDAAKKAGIYLIARPGPYINAEVSGGGFPGWLQRDKALSRTPDFVPSTDNYMKHIGELIAKAQITNGGPVILVQPENEYTQAVEGVEFPNRAYFASVEKQLRDAGITVPLMSNDAAPAGYLTPGSGEGAVDIYGYDSYPLGFDCSNPTVWPSNSLPTDFYSLHEKQSPNTPHTIPEFQGGSYDPWGGAGFDKCTQLVGPEFARVFYKNNYGAHVSIFSLYMGYGGSNWGNLGHPGGYSSYDYGAAIAEDRTINREKYSEIKLQTNFLHASPAYLTAPGATAVAGDAVSTKDITTTRLVSNATQFYIVRHTDFTSRSATAYKLKLNTTKGDITVPQLGSTQLTLNGRDSKIHVSDYDLGGINLLYSTAEIFTWKKYSNRTVLVLYGGPDETHEVAFADQYHHVTVEGRGLNAASRNGNLVINWSSSPTRRVALVGDNLFVYFVDRNSAYNYWVLEAAFNGNTPYVGISTTPVIVNGGYLIRNATVSGNTVSLNADVNKTTTFEVIGGAPPGATLVVNGQKLQSKHVNGAVSGTLTFTSPKVSLPSLKDAKWRYIDSLPEIKSNYDDSAWVTADHKTSNNTVAPLTTPVSLYGSDYGFHTGNLLFRGQFTATGQEKTFKVTTQGGKAYASAIWLNDQLVDSFAGTASGNSYNHSASLPSLSAGKQYVFTVLVDNMGLNEDLSVGGDTNKAPRGILAYDFPTNITWKLTGNLGGEKYADPARGPLNEGGLFAERQGFHLPTPPTTGAGWSDGSPLDGISAPGVGFWTTSFKLSIPAGYDIPIEVAFANSTASGSGNSNYRAQLYVNGYQFGKFVNNIGPQTNFRVPQGILNYNGDNTLAVSLWSFDKGGNKLSGLELVTNTLVQSSYGDVPNSPMPAWSKRAGAY